MSRGGICLSQQKGDLMNENRHPVSVGRRRPRMTCRRVNRASSPDFFFSFYSSHLVGLSQGLESCELQAILCVPTLGVGVAALSLPRPRPAIAGTVGIQHVLVRSFPIDRIKSPRACRLLVMDLTHRNLLDGVRAS